MTIEMTTATHEQAEKSRLARVAQFQKGGKMSPCPKCGIPRFQMSDYLRCHNCALNWSDGEDLDRDPRVERFEKMKAQQTKSQNQKARGDV